MSKAEKQAEPAKTEEKAAAKRPAIPSRLMYLGPTVAENGIQFSHGRIFNNGLPAEWLEKALRESEFMQLLVPFDKVAAANTELSASGSRLAAMSGKVAARHRERLALEKEGRQA